LISSFLGTTFLISCFTSRLQSLEPGRDDNNRAPKPRSSTPSCSGIARRQTIAFTFLLYGKPDDLFFALDDLAVLPRCVTRPALSTKGNHDISSRTTKTVQNCTRLWNTPHAQNAPRHKSPPSSLHPSPRRSPRPSSPKRLRRLSSRFRKTIQPPSFPS
jgi:hypothetical protein